MPPMADAPRQRGQTIAEIAVNFPFANAVPFLHRENVQETYFCHICFMNNAKQEGFALSNCGHMFCTECIKQYWSNRIAHGNVHLRCFHPINDKWVCVYRIDEYCGKEVNEMDILQVVDKTNGEKFCRFKESLKNPNIRQCPKCDHSQSGSPDQPTMSCEKCNTVYCFYHSVAHPIEECCEAYESRMLKQDKLNREVTDNTKPCPHCKYLIEKSGGCNHMKVIPSFFFFFLINK
ncbi:hypothetical protein RFI_21156 [Reticulomyxa filosa]|uniref:RING-type domain-containing protein n=1 Tax=Reticulomyxa filosa TaxID=46433 RepID=X6MRA8_RETFI|nr:hypothetical protein RFI_21156 [Reticulomyxa filosa]|eukprot:ETO16201.1 hypothetical protein RFI_21156 [Reticulomyxa filosa]